jgi:hypothetical protein
VWGACLYHDVEVHNLPVLLLYICIIDCAFHMP